MVKLAILCSIDSWGGLEMNTFRLCKWLSERGNKVVLIGKPESKLINKVSSLGIPTIAFTQKRKHLNLKAAKRLAKILDKENIECLLISHYQQFYTAVLAKFFSKQRLKVINWQHMQITSRKQDIYHSFFYGRLDLWVTPLLYLKEQLLRQTRIDEGKVRVIPFGIEVQPFVETSKQNQSAKATFNLSKNDFVIGTLGRLDKVKGQEYLIEALHLIKDKAQNVKVLLIGEETYGEEGYLAHLKSLSQKFDLEDSVVFYPFVKDTPTAFKALDIFVMSSLSEPFGMVTIEAMASAKAIIGTNAGGTPELLDNGSLGILVEPKNIRNLANAILELYEDVELRESLGQKAQKFAIQEYSHISQCEAFEEMISKL